MGLVLVSPGITGGYREGGCGDLPRSIRGTRVLGRFSVTRFYRGYRASGCGNLPRSIGDTVYWACFVSPGITGGTR